MPNTPYCTPVGNWDANWAVWEQEVLDHTNPDGESPFDRMSNAGYSYSYAGENIAAGYPSPSAVVAGWMGSTGHCKNIMSPNFTEIGVGYHGAGNQWTHSFGKPL